ncbi:MAG: methylated-DNA--[protein]-cysteine S-methyltransferase [Pseudodesulfovibrio sp.]
MPERPTIRHATVRTRFGHALAAFTPRGLCSLELGDGEKPLLRSLAARFPTAELVESGRDLGPQLAAITEFLEAPGKGLDIPLDPHGSDFQKAVWRQLMAIPAGQTRTYSDVARAMGRPEAVRAVASACGRNRLAVAVPCHRVVRKDGGLGGFFWGIERKKALLENEATE